MSSTMENAKNIENHHLIKQRDAASLLEQVQARLKARHHVPGLLIVEIGSSTGKTTKEISKAFPQTQVVGIEEERSLHDYAVANNSKQQANLSFVCASIWQTQFWSQVSAQMPQLKKHSVDIILSTHYLDLANPNMEIALANIGQMLKPYGFLVATMSLWSELFNVERRVATKKFPDIFAQIQRANPQEMAQKPDWLVEKAKLKQMLQRNGFGDSPELVTVFTNIKMKQTKQIQDAIKCICPLGQRMPESIRLHFYSQFFEAVHNEYFGPRNSTHTFTYEYLATGCCKL